MTSVRTKGGVIKELVLHGLAAIGDFTSSRGAPVLHYHSVNGENQASVTREAFYQQMRYLRDNGFSVVTLERLVDYLNGKEQISEKSIVLTFDDGYKTNYEIAFPVLKEMGFTATIFLTTGRIGKTSDWDTKKDVYGLPLMSWSEVREMSRHGIEFGAHSDTHPDFTQIDAERARDEISVSKAKIEDATGMKVKFFAFPYGYYNEDAKAIVKEFDFLGACTTEPGLNRPGQDLFAIKRSGVFRDTSLAGFRTRLNGTFRWFFYTKRLLRGSGRHRV